MTSSIGTRAPAGAGRLFRAAVLVAASCGMAFASAETERSAPDLEPIKAYTLANAQAMREATARLSRVAADYDRLLAQHGGDYQTAWNARSDALSDLIRNGREAWVDASTAYELSEGIIAGVPSLAWYDVWIDAGPSGPRIRPRRSIGPSKCGTAASWSGPAICSIT